MRKHIGIYKGMSETIFSCCRRPSGEVPAFVLDGITNLPLRSSF